MKKVYQSVKKHRKLLKQILIHQTAQIQGIKIQLKNNQKVITINRKEM